MDHGDGALGAYGLTRMTFVNDYLSILPTEIARNFIDYVRDSVLTPLSMRC